eukprot:1159797-Pelagomonas_calceolata.AAC.10
MASDTMAPGPTVLPDFRCCAAAAVLLPDAGHGWPQHAAGTSPGLSSGLSDSLPASLDMGSLPGMVDRYGKQGTAVTNCKAATGMALAWVVWAGCTWEGQDSYGIFSKGSLQISSHYGTNLGPGIISCKSTSACTKVNKEGGDQPAFSSVPSSVSNPRASPPSAALRISQYVKQ